jgi:hypothetical protein
MSWRAGDLLVQFAGQRVQVAGLLAVRLGVIPLGLSLGALLDPPALHAVRLVRLDHWLVVEVPAFAALGSPQRLGPFGAGWADRGEGVPARHEHLLDLARGDVGAAQLHRPQACPVLNGNLPHHLPRQRHRQPLCPRPRPGLVVGPRLGHQSPPVGSSSSLSSSGPGGRSPHMRHSHRRAAARDALHFAALFDRFVQNLRRFLGHDLQYFAAVEPQRRLAPHIHIAMRGTVSRAELRQVLAATYHQVWWPDTSVVRYDSNRLPIWHEQSGTYLDPATGELLPAWDDALDAIGADDEPLHVARFGPRFDAQGVLAGSKDSARCIGYLVK